MSAELTLTNVGAWLRPVRRGVYLMGRGAARRLPLIVRRKALRLLVDSMPPPTARAVEPQAAGWPREVEPRAADVFAASMIAAGEDRARELAYTLATRVLSARQQTLLRWRLAARVPVDYSRASLKLHVGSPDELTMAHLPERQPWIARWIEQYMAQGHTFCDVGANIGVFAILAARLYGPPMQVWAFEPAFMNFESLCRNVIANGCEDTVTALPIAVTDRSRLETLHYMGLYAAGSVHFLGSGETGQQPPRYRAAVVALALDDLVATFRMPVPNHIRVGIDSPAAGVLRGASTTLADPRLLSLLLEIPAERGVEEQIAQLVSPFDFRLAERHASRDVRAGGRDTVSLLYVRAA